MAEIEIGVLTRQLLDNTYLGRLLIRSAKPVSSLTVGRKQVPDQAHPGKDDE